MSEQAICEDAVTEHQLFWMLVKKARKRDDVGRVYLAIQAAIAYGQETVDVGWLAGAMMADGQGSMSGPIGADGLACFWWLYEVELVSPGDDDRHQYRFRRRRDGAQILATLRTATVPASLQFRQEHERARRFLENKRAALLPNYRRGGNPSR